MELGLSPDLSGLSADPSDVTRIHTTVNDADICRRRTQFSSHLAKLYEKLRHAKDVSDPRNDVHTEDDVQNLDARMPMNDGEGGGDLLNGLDMEDNVLQSDPITPTNDGEANDGEGEQDDTRVDEDGLPRILLALGGNIWGNPVFEPFIGLRSC
ncbi:hypothetical protein AgCh_015031 [Apium graveolens]